MNTKKNPFASDPLLMVFWRAVLLSIRSRLSCTSTECTRVFLYNRRIMLVFLVTFIVSPREGGLHWCRLNPRGSAERRWR